LKDFNDESKFRKKLKDISKYGNVALENIPFNAFNMSKII
jgi:hypothetical protein